MKGDPRDPAQVREHYEIEKQLATQLRAASQEERTDLYGTLYDELFSRVPHHSQLKEKNDEVAQQRKVRIRFRLLERFLQPTLTFLELGAGDCSLSFAVAQAVKRVYALDVSKHITTNAQEPSNFTLVISDGWSVPLPEQSIDLAYSDQLMEHLHPADAIEQLRNLYRALAPGGRYICITPNRLCGPHDISRHFSPVPVGFHLKEYTITELNAIFNSIGFSHVQVLLSVESFVLPWVLPVTPFLWIENGLTRLPRSLRKRFASRLIAAKVLATK